MPQYERVWTQENLDKLMEIGAKCKRDFNKVATELFGDASKANQCQQKYEFLKKKSDERHQRNIARILHGQSVK